MLFLSDFVFIMIENCVKNIQLQENKMYCNRFI